jgi:hypothetical protein
MEVRSTGLINTRSTLRPKFIYCCHYDTDQLLKTNLFTRELSSHRAPGYQFKQHSTWSELPGGSLLVTGGGAPIVREVVKIDALRECAVSCQAPMHSARFQHAAVYHSQYLYVLAGYNCGRCLDECERYVCAESRWEVLPALTVACCALSAVVLDDSLYALGGYAGSDLDTVQKLSLDSLTWKFMQLKLPQAAYYFACFKSDTEVYLVIKETLYSFTPLQVKPLKTVAEDIWCFSSYYSRGTLYYDRGDDIESLAVGELTSL